MNVRYLKHCSGATLVELLMVVLLIAILANLALPAFVSMAKAVRLQTAVDALFRSMQYARSESVTRNGRTVVCKSSTGLSCSSIGGWEQGWIVFFDANDNGILDLGESVSLRQAPMPSEVSLTGNGTLANYISFNGSGRTTTISGAFQAGKFTGCVKAQSRTEARMIVVSGVGRARLESATVEHCG